MRRRRILKCALTFMVLLGIFWSGGVTALAAGEVTVQVNAVSVSPGQTVTTELIMDGTFAAFQGRLVYDTEALTLEDIKATSAISGGITMFNKDEITGEFKNGSFASASANNMAVNGAVLTLTFRAGSNANGTYSFSIEQFLVYDEKGAELTVNAVDMLVDKGIQEPTNQEPSNQGSSTNQGSTNQESSKQGSSNQESSNQGSSNQGSSNSESSNQESTTTSNANDLDSDHSGGIGLVILLIVSAFLIVGIVVAIVFRAKKKTIK